MIISVAKESLIKSPAQNLSDHLGETANESANGHIQLATSIEVTTGTNTAKAVTPAGAKVEFDKKSPLRYAMSEISTSETLALNRANTRLKCNLGSLITITIPLNSSVAFAVGDEIEVIRYGSGDVTFAPIGGVTLLSKDSKRSIDGRYTGASLLKIGTDEWLLIGSLV